MYELRVLSGVSRGASLPLIGQRWQIGRSELADLVLLDADIFPEHCQIEQHESMWCLHHLQGTASDETGQLLADGARFEANSFFCVAGVWLTVAHAETGWDSALTMTFIQPSPAAQAPVSQVIKTPKRKKALHFFLGFISAVTIAATSTWAALYPSPDTHSQSRLTAPADQRQSLPNHHQVIHTLQAMIEARELDGVLTLKPIAQKVVIQGSLTHEQQQKLERMLARFQQQYHTTLNIVNNTSSVEQTLPFDIVQITSGPMASVITTQGQRLFVGDEIQGLRLVSIDSGKVIFKGQREFEISW